MKQIYCDHSATTPVASEVLNLMDDILKNNFGNPSSIHRYGQSAKAVIEKARKQIADTLVCSPGEIFFTGGGSESNNTVLKGILKSGGHFITSSIEHPSIMILAEELQNSGIDVTYVKPDHNGIIQLDSILNEIKENTKLISIMMVNNELGTINPIVEIGDLAKSLLPLLMPFSNNILTYDPWIPDQQLIKYNVKPCSLNYLLQKSDIIYVLASITSKNQGIIKLLKL